jgi:hypothetical protein
MGLNLESIKDDDDLFDALGSGDWVLELPLKYPDFVLSAAWRREQETLIAQTFVRWVLRGQWSEITHDADPSWDSSGMLRRTPADPLVLLTRYDILMEWMDNTPSGHSTATYESGCGLHWETYSDMFEADLESAVYTRLEESVPGIREEDGDWDAVIDEFSWSVLRLVRVMIVEVGHVTTSEAWARHKLDVMTQIATEQRAQAEASARHGRLAQLVREFWTLHFPTLVGVTLDKSVYHAHEVDKRLVALFADADPMVVEAFTEAKVPAMTSNSVDQAIRMIAEKALGK